jgi:hypothetical protein
VALAIVERVDLVVDRRDSILAEQDWAANLGGLRLTALDRVTEVPTVVRDPQTTCPLRARSAGQRQEITVSSG